MLKKQLEIKKKKQLGIEKQIPTGPVVDSMLPLPGTAGLSSGWKTKIRMLQSQKNKFKKKWKN